MLSNDLTATFSVSQAIRGGTEPAGTTTSLRVTRDGFHDSGGLGGSGQESAALDAQQVASVLLENYDAEQLRTLLSYFVRLHDALRS